MTKKTPIAAAFAAALLLSGFADAGSNVIGSVETDVRVNRASQTQSGLLNKQEARLGSVSDSNVIGSVETNVRANRFSQTQSGLLNGLPLRGVLFRWGCGIDREDSTGAQCSEDDARLH